MAAFFQWVLGGVLRVLAVALVTGIVLVIFGASPTDLVVQFIDHGFLINDKVRFAALIVGLVLIALIAYAALYPTLPGRAPNAVPAMTTRDAMLYLLDSSAWAKKHAGDNGTALRAIENAARSGRLCIWGRRPGESDYQQLKPDYWETSSLDLERHGQGGWPRQVTRTRLRPGHGLMMYGNPVVYEDLRVDPDQLKRVYPRRLAVAMLEAVQRFLPHKPRLKISRRQPPR